MTSHERSEAPERRLLLRVEECAERLNLSRSKLYRIIGRPGGIPVVKIGASTRIRVSDLERWVAEQAAA